MTKVEFAKIINYLSACYGLEYPEDKLEVWYDILQDMDFNAVKAAVKKLSETESNGYSINPALIRKACAELMIPDGYGVGQATANVMQKLSTYGNNGCIEALEELKRENELAWQVAKDIGWYNMCYGNPDKIKESFERTYKELLKEYMNQKTVSRRTQGIIGVQCGTTMIEG